MSDLECREFVELVTAHLDRALDAATEQRFVDHLGACDGCTNYLEQIRTTIALTGAVATEGLSPGARGALIDAFHDWKERRPG